MMVVVVVSKLAFHHPSPFGHDLANSTSAQSPEVPLGSSECKVKGTCQAPKTLCAGSSASWCNAWPLKVTQVLQQFENYPADSRSNLQRASRPAILDLRAINYLLDTPALAISVTAQRYDCIPSTVAPRFQQQGSSMVRNRLIQSHAQGQLVFPAVGWLHETRMTWSMRLTEKGPWWLCMLDSPMLDSPGPKGGYLKIHCRPRAYYRGSLSPP